MTEASNQDAPNNAHDLGGKPGFGIVAVEPNEPTFHEDWEQIAFLLNIASIGTLRAYNADEYRHAIERMPADDYLPARYYERTLIGVTTLLLEKGLVARSDLEQRAAGRIQVSNPAVANRADGRSRPTSPSFAVGERVRVRNMHPPGHTRVPRYVRGHSGTVLHVAPAFKYPDASAHGLPYRKEFTYHVEFAAQTLWPHAPGAQDTVIVDLWETYLEVIA